MNKIELDRYASATSISEIVLADVHGKPLFSAYQKKKYTQLLTEVD